tara:strand:- start:113 stop:475 length:363 start_codon:yes stop_codon:yes gene_type:complete
VYNGCQVGGLNMTKDTHYQYSVDYFDEDYSKELYDKFKEGDSSYQDFLSDMGYLDSFVYLNLEEPSEKEAIRIAKSLSKKHKDMASVNREFSYIDHDNKVMWEYDEDYEKLWFSHGEAEA